MTDLRLFPDGTVNLLMIINNSNKCIHLFFSIKISETLSYLTDGSAAGPGSPEAILTSPDSETLPVALTAAGPGLWRATYTPRRAGDHQLRVMWAGRLVKGDYILIDIHYTSTC